MKEIEECFIKVKNDYLNYLKNEKIFVKSTSAKIEDLKKIYIPLSYWIENKYKKKRKTLFLGLSGGQGAGKTTVAGTLKIILNKFFKRRIHISSIDDFYKTLIERNKMSRKIHPLFKTRGVPGTHDINLLNRIINNIELGNLKNIKIPIFSKNLDDRLKKTIKISYIPDIIIIEGWCINTSPLPRKILMKSINIIEKKFDKNYVWRQYYNNQLKNYYKDLFLKLNFNIFLKVPNYKKIFKWKQLQEKKLSKNNIINQKKLKYFIMHYEKITKWMIKRMPLISNLVIFVDNDQKIKKIQKIN